MSVDRADEIAAFDSSSVSPPVDTVKREQLVTACRILAMEGHADNLAGQITVRSTDDPDHFLTLPLGQLFAEATTATLCVVDENLNIVAGEGRVNPALRFHLWIYSSRPDLQSSVHTHAPYTSALSMLGRSLQVAHMDTAMFYEDCAFLPEWPGVPFGDEEGEIISECMGDKRSILLAHHGYITTGRSIAEATYLASFFERAAMMQIRAESAGTIQELDPDLAREAHDFLLSPDIVNTTFAAWERKVKAENREH